MTTLNGTTECEWLCTTAMTLGAPAVDFSVNEPLKVNLPARGVDGVAVQCELDDVVRGNTAGRHVPGEQEPVRIGIVPGADVGRMRRQRLDQQNVIGDDEVLDQL